MCSVLLCQKNVFCNPFLCKICVDRNYVKKIISFKNLFSYLSKKKLHILKSIYSKKTAKI